MKRVIFIIPVLLCLLGASCKKTKDTSVTGKTYDKKKLGSLFGVLKTIPQQFFVNAGVSDTIVGEDSTVITFYPNSFKDASGNVITSGIIKIELTEMYKPGDIIANGTSTVSGGYLLKSGGQVYIKATKGGQEVFTNGYRVAFWQPAPSSQPMALFTGNNNNEDSIVTWTMMDTAGTGNVINGTGSGNNNRQYVFESCTRFNWINCDYFFSSASPVTNINIMMPDTSYNPSNTRVFLVFPYINSVCASGYSYVEEYAFFRSFLLPTNLTVHVITITVKGNKYYYAEKNGLTVTNYLSVQPEVKEMTLAELKAKLNSL